MYYTFVFGLPYSCSYVLKSWKIEHDTLRFFFYQLLIFCLYFALWDDWSLVESSIWTQAS